MVISSKFFRHLDDTGRIVIPAEIIKEDQAVTDGVINISNVTGDIVINAVTTPSHS